MRKKFKLIAILLACFLFSNTVYAEEVADISNVALKQETFETLDINELMKNSMNNATDQISSYADMPLFMVFLEKDDDGLVLNAFYVRDTYGTGNTYLIGSSHIAAYVEEGYTVTVLGPQGEYPIASVYTDSTGVLTYMTADGLDAIEPFEMTNNIQNAQMMITSLTIEDNAFSFLSKDIDINTWENDGVMYQDGEKIEYNRELGAVVLDKNTMKVWGIQQVGKEALRLVFDLNELPFLEEAAIVQGTGESETTGEGKPAEEPGEPAEEPQEEPASSDHTKWFVIAVIAVAAFYYMKKKKPAQSEPKSPAPTPVAEYHEGTVPLHAGPANEPTQPIAAEQHAGEVRYQLRGLNGVFEGSVFEVRGSITLGRGGGCQVVYPPKTAGVSGTHCVVTAGKDGVIVRDLQSSYGTYFEGTKMQPQLEYHLKAGDIFWLGDTKQKFRVENLGEYQKVSTLVVKAVAEPNQGEFYYANEEGKIVFGRGNSCQVKFKDYHAGISTKHCVLYKESGSTYLMDNGSTNGTFMSENLRLKPNVPYKVQKGDTFFLASEKYTFVIMQE